jgi:hypothetical protein
MFPYNLANGHDALSLAGLQDVGRGGSYLFRSFFSGDPLYKHFAHPLDLT